MMNVDQKNRKLKVVAVGLYLPGTGFTRVLTSLFSRLSDQYEIHWLAIGYKAAVRQKNGYALYPTNLEGGDLFGAYQMAELADTIQADIIFLLNDFWILRNYQKCIENMNNRPTTIAYVPLDGKIDQHNAIADCNYLDYLVCYNQFSLKEVKNAFATIAKEKNLYQIPNCRQIPHGTDLIEFKPLPNRKETKDFLERSAIKSKVFPKIPSPRNSFIVLNANRACERKALHLTLEGFAKFGQNKPNAFLCLHLPNTPKSELEQINQSIQALNIDDNVIINPIGDQFVENDRLNELYNACDIGLNTSYGEGWGMIAFEHAATGAVQIVPRHTACEELWKNVGELVEIALWKRLNSNPFLMGQIDVNHLTERLNMLFDNKNYLLQQSIACYKKAVSNEYNWQQVALQWHDLMQGAENTKITKNKFAHESAI